jgi:hypothetical protein
VIDLFLDHSSINIIGAEAQRDLRNLRRHHLPVGFDMRKIVEYQSADSDLLDVEHPGSFRQVL